MLWQPWTGFGWAVWIFLINAPTSKGIEIWYVLIMLMNIWLFNLIDQLLHIVSTWIHSSSSWRLPKPNPHTSISCYGFSIYFCRRTTDKYTVEAYSAIWKWCKRTIFTLHFIILNVSQSMVCYGKNHIHTFILHRLGVKTSNQALKMETRTQSKIKVKIVCSLMQVLISKKE